MTTAAFDLESHTDLHTPAPGLSGGKRAKPEPKQKILIIDDDKSIHTLCQATLEDPHYAFHSAFDGPAGLAAAEAIMPDLVLLDVDLPKVTGYFVCRYLKANPQTSAIPVIFITGASSAEDMVCGLELQAADFIIKPFDEADLQVRVSEALRAKKTRDRIVRSSAPLQRHVQAMWPAKPGKTVVGSTRWKWLHDQEANPWTRIGRVLDRFHQNLDDRRAQLRREFGNCSE